MSGFYRVRNELKLYLHWPVVISLLVMLFSLPLVVRLQNFDKFNVQLYLSSVAWLLFVTGCTLLIFLVGMLLLNRKRNSVWLILSVAVVAGNLAGTWLSVHSEGQDMNVYFSSASNFVTLWIMAPFSYAVCLLLHYVKVDHELQLEKNLLEKQKHIRQQDKLRHIAREEQSQRKYTEVQLRLLQAQVEPHFIFNTLAHLDALIEDDPAAASKFLAQFVDYLRAITPVVNMPFVTLQQEAELVEQYLSVQQSRFGEQLSYNFVLEPECLPLSLPSMMILTLVENAVKHGVEPALGGGHILIEACIRNSEVVLRVVNSGEPLKDRSDSVTRTGLRNIRERLASIYSDNACFTLNTLPDAQPHYTVATIRLPVQSLQSEFHAATDC